MIRNGILKDHTVRKIPDSLVEAITLEEKAEFETLEVLDIELEQAEYLQTIGEGWAHPLERYMNELELLEVMHMKTLTDAKTGERHLLSVPITQAVSAEDKTRLQG